MHDENLTKEYLAFLFCFLPSNAKYLVMNLLNYVLVFVFKLNKHQLPQQNKTHALRITRPSCEPAFPLQPFCHSGLWYTGGEVTPETVTDF